MPSLRSPAALIVALILGLLPGCSQAPPGPTQLCMLALAQVGDGLDEGVLSSDLRCEVATADGKTGVGQATVVVTVVRSAPEGARSREVRRLAVALQEGEDAWEASGSKAIGEAKIDELKPGDPLDPKRDPASLAGELPIPEATGAWTVPSIWFALPLVPGGEVDRSWALGLADRGRIEASVEGGDPEEALDRRIAAAVGVLADIDRLEATGSPFGRTEGPRWSEDTSWLMHDAPGLAAVTVSRDGLWLGALPLAGLTEGRLHEESLRGQLVGPLYDALNELRDGIRGAEELSGEELSTGDLLVIAGADVPADTLHRIAFTAGQARFADLFLLVRDEQPRPVHEVVPKLRATGGSVVLDQEPGRLMAGRRGTPPAQTDDPAGFVRGQRAAGVIATSRGVDVAAVAGLLDAAHAGSPGCVAWHTTIPEPPASGPAPAMPAQRSLPSTPDVVTVLPWVLPLIGSGPCSNESRSGGGVGLAAGGPTILGSLGEDQIRSVVDSHRSALRTCQRSGLARGLGAAELTVKFVVGSGGAVSSSRIRSSTLNDDRVEECIRQRFGQMQFPPPPGGGITIVHWPLELGR